MQSDLATTSAELSNLTLDPTDSAETVAGVQQTHSAKNEFIHGLRGLLAFFVFCFHIENSGLPTFHGRIADCLNLFLASMRHGVEIFFGISGIVIFYSYQKSKSNRAFFINRITRIYPVLWATIFVILAGASFDRRHDDSFAHFGPMGTMANLLAFPTLVPVDIINPTSWTLSYEFAFYSLFVAASLLAGLGGRMLAVPLCALIVLALLASHLKALLFLSGVLIVIWAKKIPRNFWLFRFPLVQIGISMMIWDEAFSLIGRRASDADILQLVAGGLFPVMLFILATVFATVGLVGVFFGTGEARYLNTGPMRWLGTISFSLYMWQPVTAAVIKKFIVETHLSATFGDWSQILFFALALPCTLLIAHASQVLIEDRLTRFLRGIFRPKTIHQAN